MRPLVVALILISSFACAKVVTPPRAKDVDRGDKFEVQVLMANGAKLTEELRLHNEKFADWKKRMATQYGIDFEKGDDVQVATGKILWRDELDEQKLKAAAAAKAAESKSEATKAASDVKK